MYFCFIGKVKSILTVIFLIILFYSNCYSQSRDLNYYIQSAYKNNPVLYENNKQISSYNTEKELIYSELRRPRVYGTANYLFAPTINEYGYDSATTNGGWYSAMLNVDFPLFNGYELSTRLEEANIEQSGYKNNLTLERHNINKEITDLYLTALQDQEQIKLEDEIINTLDYQKNVLKALISHGAGKVADYSLLEVEYQDQILMKNQLEASYQSDLMALNLSAGIKDTAMIPLKETELILADTTVHSSHFLESFTLDSLRFLTEQKSNEINYRPQIDFFINGGLNAVTYIDIYKKFGVSTGFNITFSLYDGNQLEKKNYLVRLRQDINSSQKNYFASQNVIRKRSIKNDILNQEKLLDQLNKQEENYKVLLDLFKKEFSSGDVSVIDYINILKNYISFKTEFIQNKYNHLHSINEFNYWNW